MKKQKYKRLTSLYFDGGGYHANIYNPLGGYFEEKFFIFYSKKEIITKLRNEYNVIVSRGF